MDVSGQGDATSLSTVVDGITIPAAKQEYPIPRYLNLAFTYFDVNHLGYLQLDDLSKLFNNTKLTISRRALLSLIGSDEKERCLYQFIADLNPKLPPTYVYSFPRQFSELPGTNPTVNSETNNNVSANNNSNNSELLATTTASSNDNSVVIGNMVHFKGETYDLEKLIQQVREAEATRVNLVDRFNYAIENFDKQAEEIHVLEVSRKSLTNAIKAQNDEISSLKKERDLTKKKVSFMVQV